MAYVTFELNRTEIQDKRKRVTNELTQDFNSKAELSLKEFKSLTTGLQTKLTSILRGQLSSNIKYPYSASGELDKKTHWVEENKNTKVKHLINNKYSRYEGSVVFDYDFPTERGHPYAFSLADPNSKWNVNHATMTRWILDKATKGLGGSPLKYYKNGEPEAVNVENAPKLAHVMLNAIYRGGVPNIKNFAENWTSLKESNPNVQSMVRQLDNLFKVTTNNQFKK